MKKRSKDSSMGMSEAMPVPLEAYSPRHQFSTTLDSVADRVAVRTVSAPGNPGSQSSSTYSQSSGYVYSSDSKRETRTGNGQAKSHEAKPRWLKNVKNWLSVSEPSAQALKHQRVSTYRRYGIDLNDPNAAAKMHLPIGKVPDGVTTSTAGPNPERALQERTSRYLAKQQYSQHSGSVSRSSGISSGSNRSMKDTKKIAPWVE